GRGLAEGGPAGGGDRGGRGDRRGYPQGVAMEGQAGGERSLVLAGRHPVLEALRSGTRPIDEVLIEGETAGTRHRDILALARQAGGRDGAGPPGARGPP